MVTQEVIKKLQELAGKSLRKEICGLVDEQGSIVPIRNVSSNPDEFVFHKADYGRFLGSGLKIAYLYHSHLTGCPEPSTPDRASQQKHKFDLLIVTPTSWRYIPYEP